MIAQFMRAWLRLLALLHQPKTTIHFCSVCQLHALQHIGVLSLYGSGPIPNHPRHMLWEWVLWGALALTVVAVVVPYGRIRRYVHAHSK